jgi:membrane protease YdiL (CAAX protease family)
MFGKSKFKRISIFLILTFLLSWGFDGLILYFSDSDPFCSLGMNPWGMLIPAFVALILQMFFFKESPIYFKTYKEKPRFIFYAFMVLTLTYAFLVLFAISFLELRHIFQGIAAILFTLWTLFVFFIYGQSDKASLKKAGLYLKNINLCPRFIFGIILFFLLQVVLNLIFSMGEFVGQIDRIYNLPIPSFLYFPTLIIFFVCVTVIGIPLSGLAVVFGEEYGWRGFFLSELVNLGKFKAVFWVGLVWGIWHIPIILRGLHTYPGSLVGITLAIIFFLLWGIIQGYAILKTGNIWLVAFMHGTVNSVYQFSLTYLVRPENKIFSFGLGIYGLMVLAVIVYFVLRDKIWKESVRLNTKGAK